MKNLLNCHSIGLHSFPISYENGLYKRIFYADENHWLWKPIELAIHPHHADIKITVLEGELFNPLYEVNEKGEEIKKYKWVSHILNGNGGFEFLGVEKLRQVSNNKYKNGESTTMKACELHTIQIEKGKICVWVIDEEIPTCDYFPINYSHTDLAEWNSNGLYIEASDSVKEKYIGQYLTHDLWPSLLG